MKMTWIRTMILSAAALTMGSAAYGQTRMVAEIPFSFRLNGTELPAGKYSVARDNNSARTVIALNNGNTVKMALGNTSYEREQGPARLIFTCREGSGCALIQVWDPSGVGVSFSHPKVSPAEKERMAVIVVVKPQAD